MDDLLNVLADLRTSLRAMEARIASLERADARRTEVLLELTRVLRGFVVSPVGEEKSA